MLLCDMATGLRGINEDRRFATPEELCETIKHIEEKLSLVDEQELQRRISDTATKLQELTEMRMKRLEGDGMRSFDRTWIAQASVRRFDNEWDI